MPPHCDSLLFSRPQYAGNRERATQDRMTDRLPRLAEDWLTGRNASPSHR
ncbi:hypothetical protein EV644_13831 [Kribbella orskensis]|uniref:Uncharacterized protein n=1 Tax=Kribbella orskensis TaxID=2512216 RepID=A0ABY2B705_9ACTN|nr:hypothetical protein EV642_14017 [Kribbella sp. VKM Ac-2500]TCO09952.1 hypothetical protein EV644_13831 [Kribbella orskensis]